MIDDGQRKTRSIWHEYLQDFNFSNSNQQQRTIVQARGREQGKVFRKVSTSAYAENESS